MALFDLPLSEMRVYKPEREEPADFDSFWAGTLADARSHAVDARFEPVDAALATIDVADVTFAGFGGQPIKGWFLTPRDLTASPFLRDGRLPCVVEYIGYGGGRGRPIDWLMAPSAGYAHFVMDVRGQGSTWRAGDTPDPESGATTGHHPGFATRGIACDRAGFPFETDIQQAPLFPVVTEGDLDGRDEGQGALAARQEIGRAAARGEVLLAHGFLAHVFLAEHNELTRAHERIGHHGAPGVADVPLAAPAGFVLELGHADGVAQIPLARVSAAQAQTCGRDRLACAAVWVGERRRATGQTDHVAAHHPREGA